MGGYLRECRFGVGSRGECLTVSFVICSPPAHSIQTAWVVTAQLPQYCRSLDMADLCTSDLQLKRIYQSRSANGLIRNIGCAIPPHVYQPAT
eukprot:1949231-Heterocapsa_arctica.AAC.1